MREYFNQEKDLKKKQMADPQIRETREHLKA